MMTNPEIYSENLKGKTRDQILKEINRLKAEINIIKIQLEIKAKGFAENSEKQYEDILKIKEMSPSLELQLDMDRKYLNAAIKSYKDAGGKYTPSKVETQDKEFNDNLSKMYSFNYCYRPQLSIVSTEIHVNIYKNKIIIEAKYYNFNEENCDCSSSKHQKHILFSNNVNKATEILISKLKNLHMGEWKSNYMPKDYDFCDGYTWNVQIVYNDATKDFVSEGDNCYPFSFGLLNELCEFYASSSTEEIMDDFYL